MNKKEVNIIKQCDIDLLLIAIRLSAAESALSARTSDGVFGEMENAEEKMRAACGVLKAAIEPLKALAESLYMAVCLLGGVENDL